MSLRLRIALALTAATVLPMVVALGLPLLRIEGRVRRESERRVDLARRQAAFLVERTRRDTAARVERAAADLLEDQVAQGHLLGGPEESAQLSAHALRERHGLDHLVILSGASAVLASAGLGPGAAVPDEGVVVRPLAAGGAPAAFFARRPVLYAREALWVVGGTDIDRDFLRDLVEMTGEPAALLQAERAVLEEAPATPAGSAPVTAEIPLPGEGWRLRVSAPAADARSERADLLTAFAGVAPIALLSAIALGVLLADRIARPIRVLAERADEIATGRSGFALVEPEEDEVLRLTRSFDRMIDSLASSERERIGAERVAAWQQVARRIAHEVKNPLSPIRLAVENLRRVRERAPDQFDRAFAEETGVILEEVESLRRLVDEFSDFARLARPQPVACDPSILVRQALAVLSARIETQDVRVSVELEAAPARIVADPDQVGRVLKNVIGNALDALESAADRRLIVRLGREERWLVIEVRDSGAGLDAESKRRIFEPYFTTRAEQGGTGLGMAIVHRIVTDHGGRIEAEGAPRQGATIRIRLPLAGPPPERA